VQRGGLYYDAHIFQKVDYCSAGDLETRWAYEYSMYLTVAPTPKDLFTARMLHTGEEHMYSPTSGNVSNNIYFSTGSAELFMIDHQTPVRLQ
jgi:hypothetical protein